MTNRELIEKLQQLPPDLPIIYRGYEDCEVAGAFEATLEEPGEKNDLCFMEAGTKYICLYDKH